MLMLVTAAMAQETSVRPGINKNFEKPDVKRFEKQWEGESREISVQRDAIVAACKIKPGMAVADVGAGTGLLTRLFAKAVGAEGKVYAVDITEAFVRHIEKTCKEQKIENVTGIVCSTDSAKLPANSVDLVMICDTYHHFEFPLKTMASVHEALRPGGRVVVIDFVREEGKNSEWIMNHVRAGQEVVAKEVESAGFKVVETPNILKENYVVIFEKTEKPTKETK